MEEEEEEAEEEKKKKKKKKKKDRTAARTGKGEIRAKYLLVNTKGRDQLREIVVF
jgi:hypothetical protein